MGHGAELGVAGDEAGALADGRSDGEGIGLGHGKPGLESCGIENLREGVAEDSDGEGFKSPKEGVRLGGRLIPGGEVVDLPDVDVVREKRLVGGLGLMQQGADLFEPALLCEEGDQFERVEHAWLRHAVAPPHAL